MQVHGRVGGEDTGEEGGQGRVANGGVHEDDGGGEVMEGGRAWRARSWGRRAPCRKRDKAPPSASLSLQLSALPAGRLASNQTSDKVND